jgi:adenine deaminase
VVEQQLKNKPQSNSYLKFLVKELKPFMDKTFATHKDKEHTFIAGSSMGGLISLYAICQYPKVFGGAACLSTHTPMILKENIAFNIDADIVSKFRTYLTTHLPSPKTHKIYFDYGDKTLDSFYKPYQDKIDTIMMTKGFIANNWVTRFFAGEDHSEKAWRKRLDIPLMFLLKKINRMNKNNFTIKSNLVDIPNKKIYPAEVLVEEGKIKSIIPITNDQLPIINYILPGFIDSHVHVESSMLVPSEFARLAVVHGTVATISDPHEIANVCGMEGVEFMINNGKQVNFKFNFGAPSCVPATIFETAGASLNSDDVKKLLARADIKYLSEMMNFPGVLYQDEEVMKKIQYAIELGKPVDGHAPGLSGETAKQYIEASNQITNYKLRITNEQLETRNVVISTDHECFTKEEALDKLSFGMKILIREGSAAKNFEALIDLLHDYPDMIMFCSDDKHPDSLVLNHINALCARAVAKGINIFKVLQAACINPIQHYKLDVGMVRVGDAADFIIAEDLINFKIQQTFINGELVAENGVSFIPSKNVEPINQFNCNEINVEDLAFTTKDFPNETIAVIEALDGQLITNKLVVNSELLKGKKENQTTSHLLLNSNIEEDILKMVVINRYNNAPIAKAFIKNFGLKKGALASTVAHDSHNIVAVGVDDESLIKCINWVIKEKGGVSAADENKIMGVALPVAGLMSSNDGYKVAADYTAIDKMTKEDLGSTLLSPFMTLSFMALLVIPHLKLSDKGLFDGDKFAFV